MATWTQGSFGGGYNSFKTSIDLADNELVTCTNAVIDNGAAIPLKQPGAAITTGLSGAQKALYLLGSSWVGSTSNPAFWAPVNELLAYVVVGSAPPQITNGTSARNLGLALPTTAPSAATGAAGNVTGTNIVYYVSFTDDIGQKSGLSPASNAVSPTADKVDLTSIPTGPANTASRDIWRLQDGVIRYVDTLAGNVATTYTDDIAAIDLGDIAPVEVQVGGAAPNLEGITAPHYGRLFGWIGRKLHFSAIGYPGIWPATYYVLFDEPIINCLSLGATMLVLTAKQAYYLDGAGVQDANGIFDFSLRKAEEIYGCDAPHSLLDTDFGPLYWSQQGLVGVSGRLQLLTDKLLSKAEVATIQAAASTIRAGYWRGTYYLFYSGGGYAFDLRNGLRLTKLTATVDAIHTAKDALYVQIGTETKQWEQGTTYYAMTVQTKDWAVAPLGERSHVRDVAIEHNGTLTVTHMENGSAKGSSQSAVRTTMGTTYLFSERGNWGPRHGLKIETASGTLAVVPEVRQIEWNPQKVVA